MLVVLLGLLLLIDFFLVVSNLLLQSFVLERQLGVLLFELRELLLALPPDLLLVAVICKLCDFVLELHHAPCFVLVLLEEDAVLQLLALKLLHDLLVVSSGLLVDFAHCLLGDWAFEILGSARFLGRCTS